LPPRRVRTIKYKAIVYLEITLRMATDPIRDLPVAFALEFLRFVALNREAGNLERCVRRELYREGFDGMIKILRDMSTKLI
jgi:hypothetical protein